MSMDNPRISANIVSEYQASGIPWVSESNVAAGVTKFSFPTVTRDLIVRNNGVSNIFVGFTENGVLGSNGFTLATDASFTQPIRVKDMFVSASATTSVSIIAGLTRIPRTAFPILTGSDGFGGIG